MNIYNALNISSTFPDIFDHISRIFSRYVSRDSKDHGQIRYIFSKRDGIVFNLSKRVYATFKFFDCIYTLLQWRCVDLCICIRGFWIFCVEKVFIHRFRHRYRTKPRRDTKPSANTFIVQCNCQCQFHGFMNKQRPSGCRLFEHVHVSMYNTVSHGKFQLNFMALCHGNIHNIHVHTGRPGFEHQ